MSALTRRTGRLAAAAVLGGMIACPVSGQTCIWSYHALPPSVGTTPIVVYHGGLQRVLVVQTTGTGVTAIRIWAWDGAEWSLVDGNGPSRRTGAAAAYDAARDRLVLFGGRDDVIGSVSYAHDTWEWDGTTWIQSIASGPVGRQSHRMVYDEARQRTVLFGGTSQATGRLGDTWEWDGAVWSFRTESGPSPRSGPAMAYDSNRMRIVLYGGSDGSSGGASDLWEWDGAAWGQRTSNVPGGGALWMVFDPARQRMVMGRQTSVSATGFETWELNPQTAEWLLRDPGISPRGPAAFDQARMRPVILGGSGFTMEFNSGGTVFSPYITDQPEGGMYPLGAQVQLSVTAHGSDPLSYQWRRGGVALVDGDNIFGATTHTLTIDPLRRENVGEYDVVITNPCASARSLQAGVYDEWSGGSCYANCDGSSVEPLLNIDDFTCFINEFAHATTLPHAQQYVHYANCDRSYVQPTLNVDDFTCFINEFAAGCR